MTPRKGTPTRMAETLDLPCVAEVREPSPTITTAGPRSPVTAVIFLAGLVEGSAAFLRFLGGLFTTSTSPEVIKSETLTTANCEKDLEFKKNKQKREMEKYKVFET